VVQDVRTAVPEQVSGARGRGLLDDARPGGGVAGFEVVFEDEVGKPADFQRGERSVVENYAVETALEIPGDGRRVPSPVVATAAQSRRTRTCSGMQPSWSAASFIAPATSSPSAVQSRRSSNCPEVFLTWQYQPG